MRSKVKKIWKRLTYFISKICLGQKVYIVNEIENLKSYQDSFSQYRQDAYIYNSFFKDKTDGIFVDVGGNHPTHWNNTYLFETKGWTGLAVEPQDNLRNLWANTRKAPCLDFVIGSEDADVVFVQGTDDEHGVSGVRGYNKVANNKTEITKKQIRLDELLSKYNISKVDYLSIDVEGYEMQVLESIDFERVKIEVIGVENDLAFKGLPILGAKLGSELGGQKIRSFLKGKGYKHVARIMCDDIFIKI